MRKSTHAVPQMPHEPPQPPPLTPELQRTMYGELQKHVQEEAKPLGEESLGVEKPTKSQTHSTETSPAEKTQKPITQALDKRTAAQSKLDSRPKTQKSGSKKPSSKASSSQASSKKTQTKEPAVTFDLGKGRVLDVAQMVPGEILKPAISGDRIVGILDFGETPYVLKAGYGNTDGEDNIINTGLFDLLAINGVRAPITRAVTPEFRAALISKLPEDSALVLLLKQQSLLWDRPAVKDYLEAQLKLHPSDEISKFLESDGKSIYGSEGKAWMAARAAELKPDSPLLAKTSQISTMGARLNVEDILNQKIVRTRAIVDAVTGKNPDDAITALADLLRSKTGAGQTDKLAAIEKLKNPQTRSKAIQDLDPNKGQKNTKLTEAAQKEILSSIEAIIKDGVNTFVESTTPTIVPIETAKQVLKDRVVTEEGAYALGSVASVDLLCGMYDRFLGDWAPANISFDPKTAELWCVDNAKNTLGAIGWFSFEQDKWKEEFFDSQIMGKPGPDMGKTIEEILYRKVYDGTDFGSFLTSADQKSNTAAAVQTALADTLKKMQILANDDKNQLPKEVRSRLQARLNMVQARRDFSNLLSFDAGFKVPPTVKNPWFGKKVVRVVGGKILGRSEEQIWAERLKKIARTPQTSTRDLQANDKELADYLAGNANADDRVLKALFATRSELFVRAIKNKTQSLKDLAAKNKAWGDLDPAVIDDNIRTTAKLWVTQLEKVNDQEGADELRSAVDEYVKQLNASQAFA